MDSANYSLSFIHPINGVFSDKYERNNKKGGVKAMKCFPTCTLVNREHGRGTLCVDSVVISIDMSKVMQKFNYQPIEVIGIGRFVTDVDIMKNDKYFGDFSLYKYGTQYDYAEIVKLLRSKQVPFNPEIFAEMDKQNRLTFSSRGWHYGWSGGRYKIHQPHRFEAIAFARLHSIPNDKFTCIGSIQGTNFEIFSSRRADPNDKLRRRVSKSLAALNAAERFASIKEEEILGELGNSLTPKNESENDADVDDEYSQNLSPNYQNGQKSEDEPDPFYRAGKRAAMNQFSKVLTSSSKKNKLNVSERPLLKKSKKLLPSSESILPIVKDQVFSNFKPVKNESSTNSLTFNFGDHNIKANDPATLAAMIVLQQNNSNSFQRNQDSFLGDIIMNPFPGVPHHLEQQNGFVPQSINSTPIYSNSFGFLNSPNISPPVSQTNFMNNTTTMACDDIDQVDNLLNDLESLEQALGIELINGSSSESEFNEPISIPIIEPKMNCKTEIHNSIHPPEMDKHSSPGAYSSDEIVSAEDEEFFRNIDIFERLGSHAPLQTQELAQTSTQPPLPEPVKIKVIDITPNPPSKNITISPIEKQPLKLKVADAEKDENALESVQTSTKESKISKEKNLLSQYAAWKYVKMRLAKMKYRAIRVMKRQQKYFFPKGVVII